MKKRLVASFIFLSFITTCNENITVIGIGRLGICFALCLEKAGYHVLGVDVSPSYVEKINNKTLESNEPLVSEYLRESKNFQATTCLEEGINFSDVILICVSTTFGTEAYNFEPLNNLLSNINSLNVENKSLVLNSTVSPGYIANTALPLLQNCKNTSFSYNPPFIAQGQIIAGLTKPDMVLIGQANEKIGATLTSIYKKISPDASIATMNVASAEITKLAVNCYITMKIAYANLVGDIADETPNAEKYKILNAVGKDTRIGSKYLLPGFGFGGPCFPRDNRGLGNYALTKNIQPLLFSATDETNKQHAAYMAEKLLEQNLDEYLFEDISYKDNSPVKIIEESQKLEVAKLVATAGKKVSIKDCKEAIELVQKKFGDIFSYIIDETYN